MDKTQEVIFNLLVDIDRICTEHSLSYFLGKDTALCALRWGKFPENCRQASVFMPANDYMRLEELLTNHPIANRSIESIKNNPSFPYLFMRFIDTRTTYISLCSAQLEKKPGIHINICKLQPYTRHSRLGLALVRSFGAVRYANALNTRPKKMHPINETRVRIIDKLGPRAAVWVYERPLTKSESYSKVYVQCHYKNNLYFDRSLFESKTQISLEGYSFPIPQDYQKYMSIMHGRRWSSRNISFKKQGTNVFIDADSPYSEYIPLIHQNAEKINRVIETRIERTNLLRLRHSARRPLDHAQRYYYRAVDRVKMEDLYLPQKERLLELYAEGDFEQLAYRMLEYQTTSEKYSQWSMGFAFDKDLYIILCDILAWERMWTTRRRITNLMEKSFAYLDELDPHNIQVATPSLYECTGPKSGLTRLDDNRTNYPVATIEQLEIINKRLREIIEGETKEDYPDSRASVKDKNCAHDNAEVE